MKQKLYCYVDETGQDTKGALFIVVVLVTDDEKDKLELFLEKALAPTKLKGKVFYRIEKNTKAYEAQTIIATEQAIRKYIASHNITDYKATIVIDGLSQTASLRVGSALRRAGIKTRRVRGEKDESNALLRLTDMVAGLIRETEEGQTTYAKLTKRLEKEGVINEL